MKTISGKELCKLLETKEWILKKIQGSHHIYIKNGRIERISVPVHQNKDLKIGLLKSIKKIANIEDNEL